MAEGLRDILDEEGLSEDSLSRRFVETRHVREVFRHLDVLMRTPMDRNHAWGMALVGPARAGKTTMVAEYLRSCGRGEDGRKPLKHLYVRLVPDTKPSNIASTTLRWMDDPSPAHGTPDVRSSRVWETLRRRAYDVVIYDEAHFLVDSDTQRVEEKGAAWFNELLNQRRCPVVLLGYERLTQAVRRNPSLQGRLMPCPAFRPWDHGNSDDINEVGYVLTRLEEGLGFPHASRLGTKHNAERICFLGGGLLGLMARFLTFTRDLARSKGRPCILPEDLRESAELFVSPGSLPFNPFAVEDFEAALEQWAPAAGTAKRAKP